MIDIFPNFKLFKLNLPIYFSNIFFKTFDLELNYFTCIYPISTQYLYNKETFM